MDNNRRIKKIDIELVLKELLKNDRLMKAVSEANLSNEQLLKVIPILIDMNKQDPEKDDVLSSFYVSRTGQIKRQEILSKKGEHKAFIKNIITQDICEVSFDDDDFYKDSGRLEAVGMFSKIVKGISSDKKGLYMYGSMGVGKTFTSKKFAKKLALDGKKVGIVNLSTLALRLKATFGKGGYEHITHLIKRVEFLFIDDIGAEQISPWFRDEFLFSVLNYRMDHKLTTFFTSNYSMKDLKKVESKTANAKYWDTDKANRIVERVKALSVEVRITGKNYR